MRKVIIVGEEPKEEKALKPIEFTYYLATMGVWERTEDSPLVFDKIVYLGKCNFNGDMFASYKEGYITIYKGHLNDGVY